MSLPVRFWQRLTRSGLGRDLPRAEALAALTRPPGPLIWLAVDRSCLDGAGLVARRLARMRQSVTLLVTCGDGPDGSARPLAPLPPTALTGPRRRQPARRAAGDRGAAARSHHLFVGPTCPLR